MVSALVAREFPGTYLSLYRITDLPLVAVDRVAIHLYVAVAVDRMRPL